MLQQLFYVIVISLACIMWGIPAVIITHKKTGPDNFWLRNITGLLCFMFGAGLLTGSFVSSIACLLVPLKHTHYLFIWGIPLLLIFIYHKAIRKILHDYPIKFKLITIESAFVLLVLLLFIVLGTGKHANNDTHIYHVQLIKWTNEYGTVPGLANLFPRFGTGSNWFNLIAVFDIPFLPIKNYSWLNCTFAIWFFLWLFNNWKYHNKNNIATPYRQVMSHFYFLIFLFSLLEWELFRDAASSTNYDFAVTTFTIVAVSWLLESYLFEREKKFSLIFCIICLSIIPFKFSGAFTVLFILFHLGFTGKLRHWIYCGVASFLILLPLLIKNYIISGYPLFPLSYTVNHPDWQLPNEMTEYYRGYIQVSNRFYNSYQLNFSQVPELMQMKWMGEWMKGLLFQQKIILFAALSSLSIFFINHKRLKEAFRLKIIFSLLMLMTVAWFLSAPSPRFGYGVLLVLAFFPICFWLGRIIPLQIHKPIIILTAFILCYYTFQKSRLVFADKKNFISVIPMETPPAQKIVINKIQYNLPDYINNGWMRDCYDTELPCIYQQNKYLYPRGSTIKEGFKMNPKPDSIFIRTYIY